MHLARHPLAWTLVVLVALFVVFFVILPALSVIIHVLIGLAIIWALFSLVRMSHRRPDPAKRH